MYEKKVKFFKQHQGFTLIELIIVVAILGILAALAVPSYMMHLKRTRESEATNTLGHIREAQRVYQTEYDVYAPDLSTLKWTMEDGSVSGKYYKYSTTNRQAVAEKRIDTKSQGGHNEIILIFNDGTMGSTDTIIYR